MKENVAECEMNIEMGENVAEFEMKMSIAECEMSVEKRRTLLNLK